MTIRHPWHPGEYLTVLLARRARRKVLPIETPKAKRIESAKAYRRKPKHAKREED